MAVSGGAPGGPARRAPALPRRVARLLPEMAELEALLAAAGPLVRSEVAHRVRVGDLALPVYVLEMGSQAEDAPAVALVGGVHGVERVGSQVVLAFLRSLVARLPWDPSLHDLLGRVRLLFLPVVNPGGMYRGTRCTPEGIDLMRNAPVEAEAAGLWPVRGQRLSRYLAWYRGRPGEPMAPEARALCDAVESRLLRQPFSLALDCHSGFGARDRLWLPYAGSRRPFERAPELYRLKQMFDTAYPNHTHYLMEPQCHHYTTHGDLWDYLCGVSLARGGVFLPLTLEMGSWLWVRKNPLQAFRALGLFNPLARHRLERTLRRHLVLLEFLLRAAAGYRNWLPGPERREELERSAGRRWYGHRRDAR